MLTFDEYWESHTVSYYSLEWHRLAKIIFPELINRAKLGKTWTYSEIGQWLLNNGHTTKNYTIGNSATKIGRPAGLIGEYCSAMNLPPLSAIIVHKDNKFLVPGDGCYNFINPIFGTAFTTRISSGTSGAKLPQLVDEKRELTAIVKKVLKLVTEYDMWDFAFDDEISIRDLDTGVAEGDKKIKRHFFRERNPGLVAKKKSSVVGDLKCVVCDFVFSEKYGDIGNGFIECHHTIPISQDDREKTKLEDLELVCSNCHRMIHKNNPPYTIDEMKLIVYSNRN